MHLLRNSRRALAAVLIDQRHSRSQISALFQDTGFEPVESGSLTKRALIEKYFDQIDWSARSSAERLFPVLSEILCELKRQSTERGSKSSRTRFARIVQEGLRLDGADFDGAVVWAPRPRPVELPSVPRRSKPKPPETCDRSEDMDKSRSAGTLVAERLSSPHSKAEAAAIVVRLCDLLASAINDADEARRIAARAGYPGHDMPDFRTPGVFWDKIVNGALRGKFPLRQLVRTAAEEFPYNEELWSIGESIDRSW